MKIVYLKTEDISNTDYLLDFATDEQFNRLVRIASILHNMPAFLKPRCCMRYFDISIKGDFLKLSPSFNSLKISHCGMDLSNNNHFFLSACINKLLAGECKCPVMAYNIGAILFPDKYKFAVMENHERSKRKLKIALRDLSPQNKLRDAS